MLFNVSISIWVKINQEYRIQGCLYHQDIGSFDQPYYERLIWCLGVLFWIAALTLCLPFWLIAHRYSSLSNKIDFTAHSAQYEAQLESSQILHKIVIANIVVWPTFSTVLLYGMLLANW